MEAEAAPVVNASPPDDSVSVASSSGPVPPEPPLDPEQLAALEERRLLTRMLYVPCEMS